MRIKYEPYKMDSFKDLMQWAYMQGWYIHRLDLVTVKIQGEFEGFSGRASETWEHQFVVSTCDVGKYKSHTATGETIEDACAKILAELKKEGYEKLVINTNKT
jgi:hypothetical protein